MSILCPVLSNPGEEFQVGRWLLDWSAELGWLHERSAEMNWLLGQSAEMIGFLGRSPNRLIQ